MRAWICFSVSAISVSRIRIEQTFSRRAIGFSSSRMSCRSSRFVSTFAARRSAASPAFSMAWIDSTVSWLTRWEVLAYSSNRSCAVRSSAFASAERTARSSQTLITAFMQGSSPSFSRITPRLEPSTSTRMFSPGRFITCLISAMVPTLHRSFHVGSSVSSLFWLIRNTRCFSIIPCSSAARDFFLPTSK